MDQLSSTLKQETSKSLGKDREEFQQINSIEEANDLSQTEKKVIIRKITQKYSMDKLMMMLDKKKLEALEEEFSAHPDGIKLGNFVWLMKAAVNHTEEEKFDLVYGLQKLFAEIDINGDEHMEWGEFTQYIIDAVIQNPSIKGSGNKNRDLLQETKMMKFKKYFSSKFKDKTSHNSWTKKVVWCQKFQSLMVFENNQKGIKLLDPEDLSQKFTITLPPQKKDVFILDIDYSNEHQMFGCIDSDLNMIFWDYFINLKICKQLKSPCLQHQLKYLKNHKTWLTMGQDNVIREYDLKRSGDPLILQIDVHKKLILDVIELISPFAIASASLDRTILIYSLVDKEQISILKEHTKGVRSLSYNPSFGGFIISVGFERNVYVWSPEVTQKKSLIGKLEGHTEIVVCAKFLNLKPFCVSIDEKYNFRFWDVRTLTCVQVITNEINSQVPIYGIFMFPQSHENERFAVLSKRLLFYDIKKKEGAAIMQKQSAQQDQNFIPNDQVNPIFVEFNKYYLNFSIVTPQDIRIYNAKDGKLQKIIQNIVDPKTKAPITSFCSDDRQRKFYVGDASGGIRTYNISNGVFIKSVQKSYQKNAPRQFELVGEMDSHEISALHYMHLENHNVQLLVTSSWDSSLQIYDEGEQPDESHILRVAVGGHGKEDISCMSVSEDLALIATGSISGIIAIWDFESNKIENYCMEHAKQISSLFFMYPLSVLISTCNEGYVCFWGLKQAPLDYRYKLLKKIRNNLEDPDLCYMKVNITCSKTKFLRTYNKNEQNSGQIQQATPIMLLGDDSGYINQWDLSKVQKQFKEEFGFKDIQSISKYLLSFNPKKNAQVNSLSASKTLIFFAEQKARKVKIQDSVNYVKRLQWFAHQAQINSITFLENPDGVLSCSADRHVKLWSLDGQLWGDINLLKENIDKQWIYPLDWSEKKAREIEKVKRLMAIVAPPEFDKQIYQSNALTINDEAEEVHQKQSQKKLIIEEQVIFEQPQKREKDKRELIDYLAKRQRRMDLEENQKRQHERQVMLQNQEQMRAQYVSNQMKYSENVYMDKFMQDVQKMTDDNYQGQMLKNSVINVMDQRFDGLIQASLKGDKITDIIQQSDGLASFAPNNNGFNRQNTEGGKTLKIRKTDSTHTLPGFGSPSTANTLNNDHPQNLNRLLSPSNQKRIAIVNYPKPIQNRKDKNKEFNSAMFSKLQASQSQQQLSSLVTLSQMDIAKYNQQKQQRMIIENVNLASPVKSAMKTQHSIQSSILLSNIGSPINTGVNKDLKFFNQDMALKSPANKVTFNDSNLNSHNKFTFYDPAIGYSQQRQISTAINYQAQLKPFSPISNDQNPSNLKGVLQNIKNSISTGNMQESQFSSLQNIARQSQTALQGSRMNNNQHHSQSQQLHSDSTRPHTSLMSSKKQQKLENTFLKQSQSQSSLQKLNLQSKNQPNFNSLNSKQNQHPQNMNNDLKISRQDSSDMSPEKKVHYALKSNKTAQTQRRQSTKIVALASQISEHADKLEYQIRKEYQLQKDIETQKQKQLDSQDVQSATSGNQKNHHKSHSNFKKNHSLSNLITSPKQRRCIIGFEGGGSTSQGNSKFLRKLNNFISQSNGPQSQINERISNIRYQKGEGMRLLKLSYNQVQFDNKVLHSSEYGYKRVEPEPQLINIFSDKDRGIDIEVSLISSAKIKDGGLQSNNDYSLSKQQSLQCQSVQQLRSQREGQLLL